MNSHNLPLSHFHTSKVHKSEMSQFQFLDLFSSLSLLPLQLTLFGPMLLNTITILLTHKFISSTILHLAFQTYTEMSPQYLYLYFIVVAQSPTSIQLFLDSILPHARLPCLSPSPGVCPSSCLLNQWCHPTISSSPSLFFFCLQPFPATGAFPKSQLFASGVQSIGTSALVFPMSTQVSLKIDWFDLLTVQGTNVYFDSSHCTVFYLVYIPHVFVYSVLGLFPGFG